MAKKILKRSLALGALMAFVITGSAMAEDYGKKSISSEQILGNANEDLKINYNARGGLSNDFGIRFYLPSRASKEINPSVIGSNISINIYNNGTPYEQIINGIYSYAANKTVGGTLYVGNNETKSISINVNAEGLANGIYLKGVEDKHGTKVVIDSENLTIDSNSDTSYSRAIYVGNNTTDLNGKNPVTLVINSDNTIINSTAKVKVDETDGDNHAIGISALSQGVVEINGSVEINADTVLSTRGGAITKINAANDSTRTVKLNGDIDFNYSNTTDVDADVTINLANVDSVFNGKISVTGNPPVGMAQVNGMNISFSNGAAWNLTGASVVTKATFGDGSTLKIKGADFTDKYAITGKVTMAPTASLVIDEYTTDTAYKVVKGENNIAEQNLAYDRTQYFAEEITGSEYQVTFKDFTDATGEQVAMAQQQAVKATGGNALAAPSIITGAIGPDAPAAAKELVSAITSSGASIDQKAAMVNAVAKIGEASGTTANAASVVNNVTSITTQRLSFTNVSTTPQGGHGKVERKYKSGAGVWAQYMHGKDKVEDMPSAGGVNSYDSQYNGAVIGYDFKEVGKTHSGISFNYGEGDSHSKNSIASTRNDFDFWGVGAYTSIMNDDTNLIFDINYNKSDADVKQNLGAGIPEVTVNPKTTSFSVGVKAEKLIQNGPVQIVPYAGARFLTIDTDEYTSSAGTVYAPERQNIWLIPVGVSLRQENVYENGWKVTPKADLSYIWALGDTDSSMTVTTGAASDPIAYTVMDNGSFLGTLGIEAAKGDWTYGLSYSYQKGEYQRSDKWFVDVRYSF